jgi:hypothetical protein
MIYSKPPANHPMTPVKIALLTGLSNPCNCALSDVQRTFIASLRFPEAWKVYCNFPWTAPVAPATATPLWRAGLHNGWQFLAASTPLYRRIAKMHWDALLSSTEHLLIITGSCGLQIANCLLSGHPPCKTRIDILGFGPVAWRRPPVKYRLVQNENDPISHCFFRKTEDILTGSGHMTYLEDQRFLEIAEQWISNNISS